VSIDNTTDTQPRRFDHRDSGVPQVDTLSWGSHFCVIHDSIEDVFDLAVPYFKAGLDNNEQCLWVVPEPSDLKAAATAVAEALPGVPDLIQSGQLVIIPRQEYDSSAAAMMTRLDAAIASGWDGLRIAVQNVTEADSGSVTGYCGSGITPEQNIIVACLYPRSSLDALRLMEVVKNHSFALLRNASRWEIVESSEAHMAREALKRSEEKLQSLFGSMSEGFAYHRIVVDENGEPIDYVFLEVNEAFEEQTGLKGEDIIGRKATEVLPGIEADPTDWIGRYGRVALTGEPAQFESLAQMLDKWYSVSVFSSHKGFFGATFTDITGRKKAEQSLREREEELTSIYENAPILMLLVDEERRVLKANRSVLEFTGSGLAELSGLRAGEALGCLNAQDDPGGCGFGPQCQSCPVRLAITRIFESGQPTNQLEASRPIMVNDQLMDITFLLSIAPVSVQGESRALLTIQDISDRKRAEENISQQNVVLAGINDILKSSLVAISSQQLAEECLALAEEITGSNFGFIGLIGPDGLLHDVAISNPGWEACNMYGKVLLDGEPLIVNDPVSHTDSIGTPEGHPPLTSFLGVPLKRGDETIGMVALANREGGYEEEQLDMMMALAPAIKEGLGRKRTEVELKQTMAKLEQSNKELQQFAYVASHDLQEPLRMVASFLQLLWQRYAGNLDDDAREFIDFAVDGANRMQVMINDLLMYSRVGSTSDEFVEVDMQQIFDRVRNDLGMALQESGAEIICGDLPVIMADPIMMSQLMQNLIGNAIKFGGDHPKITIAAEQGDGEWLFSVSDRGIGIAPEFKERIFVIFQRLHGKTEYPGTGIGLAVCRRIIDRHHGRIWVEPTPGDGSTFFFTIPE
jgi:PAS domain S-box-containing protein